MRQIMISGDVAYVPLTKGYVATVDVDDVHLVQGKLWYARPARPGLIYAVRHEYVKGKGKLVMMHRVIANTPDGLDTDHVDRNGLNNRRSNLRTATHNENQHNRAANRNNTSGYKGVTWDRATGRWLVKIKLNGKSHFLGRYESKELAHAAYVKASHDMHGAFANPGLPQEKAPTDEGRG